MKVKYVLKALIKELNVKIKTGHILCLIPFCRTGVILNGESSFFKTSVLSATSLSKFDTSGIIMAVIILAAVGYFTLIPPRQP